MNIIKLIMEHKKLIKRLSHSSEQSIRDLAIDELEQMLTKGEIKFEDLTLRAINEGLFFCYWHSDKPRYQQALAQRMANFTHLATKEEDKQMWVRYFLK